MKKYELISSVVGVIVGTIFLIGSLSLGLGRLSEPGPGFFPFIMATCLISFSLIHFISSLVKDGRFSLTLSEGFWPGIDGIKRIVLTITFLCGFGIALNYMGFVLSAVLFMVLILRLVEPQKWRTVFLIGILTTVLSYLIFQQFLEANLPTGFLGF